MRDLTNRKDLLALNTATLGHNEPIEKVVDAVAKAGFGAITPWRRDIDESDASKISKHIKDAGLKVHGYCRTAYLSGPDEQTRKAAVKDNLVALNVAAELEADCFVAVVGGLAEGSKDIQDSRQQIIDGLAILGETAAKLNVPIALEPLHPFYASDRSVLNTTAQALAWCKQLDPNNTGNFGVCLDVYHIWWDPNLANSIKQCEGHIMCFHVCDWLIPTKDPLLDRGMMGDGAIDIPAVREMVENAGYDNFIEVEIFSKDNWWQRPMQEVLTTCIERMTTVC